MHVAQFVHRYPPALGGAEAYAARLARDLVANGHRVTTWTTTALDLSAFQRRGHSETTPGDSLEDGVTVRRFPLSLRFPGRRYAVKFASLVPIRSWQALVQPFHPLSWAMWRAAGRYRDRPDVVHALAFPYGSIAMCARKLARRWHVPFVLTPFLHLGDPDDRHDRIRKAYLSRPLRWLLREADRVLVQMPSEADAVRRVGVSADRIVLQGLGVDASEVTGGNREAARRAWGVGPDEVVVGHLANLSLEKGSIDLLVAAEAMEGKSIRFILAGSAMPQFESFWNHHGPPPNVTRLGPLTAEQKRDFFAGIDVFAMPSQSDSFGLVFLEAWANGVPVVGYRAGGVADLIRHEVDGLLVICGDLNGLTRAIERLVASIELRQAWGEAGRARLAIEFDWGTKLRIARECLVGAHRLPRSHL